MVLQNYVKYSFDIYGNKSSYFTSLEGPLDIKVKSYNNVGYTLL